MIYDEDDHHKEIYAYAGLALYKAQCLEVEVCNLLVVHELVTNRTITADERDAFINRAERQTLGALLNELRNTITIDDDFEDLLVNALQKRNFFIHEYFRDRIAGFMSADGRDELIQELKEYVSLFDQADNRVQVFTSNARQVLGMTDEYLHPIAADMYGHDMAERLFATKNPT